MCLLHHILKNSNEHAQWMLMILMQRANNNEYTQRSEIVIILQQVRWGKLSCVVDSSSPQFFAMSCHDGREWGTKKMLLFLTHKILRWWAFRMNQNDFVIFFPSPHLLSLLSIIAYTHRYYCVVDGHHHRGERQTENDYGILSMLTSLLDRTVTILFVNWELKLTCVAFYRRFCTWQQFGIFRKTFYILHCYVETN